MKRKIFILFVLTFILFGIDVKAASEEELNNYGNLKIGADETICVFTPNSASVEEQKVLFGGSMDIIYDAHGTPGNSYVDKNVFDRLKNIVIGIKENSDYENKYDLVDYTFSTVAPSYDTSLHHIIANSVPEKADELSVNSNDCNNYIVQFLYDFNLNAPVFHIYLSSKRNIDDLEYYFEYNEEKTNSIRNKVQIDQNVNSCKVPHNNGMYQLSPYDENNHYFSIEVYDQNYKICPAKVINGYDFTRLYGGFDIDSFNCEGWKLARNIYDKDKECYYYYVTVDSEINDKQDTTSKVEGTYITKYLSNQSSNADVITITNVNGTLRAIQKNNKKEAQINITNIDNYTSTFLNKDEINYPTYITCNDDVCKFTNNKKDGKRAYIALVKIGSVLVGKELTLDTCEDLMGDSFLKFIKENVLKIVYIAIPIVLIILTSFDFAKVVFIDDKEGIQAAFKKLGKRAIVAILIYLIPTILIFVSNIFQNQRINACIKELNKLAAEEKVKNN